MGMLSSSHSLAHSLTTTTPFLLIHPFKISSVKTDEKIHKSSNIIIPTISPPFSQLPKTLSIPKIPRTITSHDQEFYYQTHTKSFLATVFRLLDDFVTNFIDPPLPPFIDPNLVLSGNYAPVDELPPTACREIEGAVPLELNGAYIRNGPNPQFVPKGPYHMFDGDGMLHSITISGGEATFCSRFVKTYKFNLERENGAPVILNVFSAFNSLLPSLARCAIAFGRVVTGQYDARRGIGVANTSLAVFGGRLFAMGESDLPYAVKLTCAGDLVTVGRHESYGEAFMTMTAHPKVDADTGEAFAFRHSIRAPFLTYFRIGADGVKQPEVPISSPNQASLVHDFAVSKNYAIFPDTQIVIKPKEILRGRPPVGVDPAKVPKLGVIPRRAVDDGEMWWIEVPDFNMVHAVNAWEEDGGDTLVMVATNVLAVEHVLERMDLIHSSMEKIKIDLKQRKIISRRPVSSANLDFAVINPAYIGKKNRYVYAGIGNPMPKIDGIVKIDLSHSSDECTVATRLYGEGCYGGEPYFVAREADNPEAAEDDGYLVSYVHNERTEESKFVVMDAKSPNLEIIASVKLPRRVPYGFHGIFVRHSGIKTF